MSNSIQVSPTKQKKRIELLDIFRGFAVLGIFVVNIEIMNSTFVNQEVFSQQWTSTIDQIAVKILQLFFYSKFFPIFSLLFGLGISMQALKLYERKELTFSFFLRRMFALFIIGLLHIILLWSGDVLHLYAMLGLLVTLLIRISNRMLLILSAFFLLFPYYDQIFGALFNYLDYQPHLYLKDYAGAEVVRIISEGTYLEGIKLRFLEYMSNIPILYSFLAPVALSMFLLGLYFGKKKIWKSLEAFIEKIKKPVIFIAILTNCYRILFLFYLPELEIYRNESLRPLFFKFMFLSDIVMGLFYLWGIGWIWYNSKFQRIFNPFKYVGRMALTNYVMHSVFGVILFSSLGFKLYESLSPIQTLLSAVAVFIFQVIYSKIWLTYFLYGPLEWVWRCLTYREILPIRKLEYSEVAVSN
ncbi:MAG TPA: DUF418 domain-containing protein [Salegentibacter sp.]|uniref:DUF418 domain-containing protein n=1 Tax=Salegentibacter sp. TaxID=1903072 RepID=UPI002F948472